MTDKAHSDRHGDDFVVDSGGWVLVKSGAVLNVESGGQLQVAGTNRTTSLIANPLAGTASGKIFVAAQLTTASAADTVVTGLTTVIACGATLNDNPGDDPMLVSATIGDQAGTPAAGSIIVKTWKTDGVDPTPAAASTFTKKVNWWAYGT